MQVDIRYFDYAKDYLLVSAWWEMHNSGLLEPEYLPPTGLIVEIEQQPIASGFIYRTDSKICIFEFAVCDPMAQKKERALALNVLVDGVIKWAECSGFKLIYCSTSVPKYIRRLVDKGFLETNKNQTHLFRKI